MKEIIFVRHGEAESNTFGPEGTVGSDLALTPEGVRQAEALAAYLGDLALRKAIGPLPRLLYTSPYRRTRQTADIIAGTLGMMTHADSRLAEIQKGTWHGMKVADVVALEADVALDNRPHFRPPGGENWFDVAERMAEFVEDLEQDDAETALVVSHNHPIEIAIGKLCGIAHADWEKRPVQNGSLARLVKKRGIWTIDKDLYNAVPPS